jgi:hypothetical protein
VGALRAANFRQAGLFSELSQASAPRGRGMVAAREAATGRNALHRARDRTAGRAKCWMMKVAASRERAGA